MYSIYRKAIGKSKVMITPKNQTDGYLQSTRGGVNGEVLSKGTFQSLFKLRLNISMRAVSR